MYKKTKQQIHFIGIGGIGMSGIAEVLFQQGFPVSGSDLSESYTVKRLKDLGLKIFIGHHAENIEGATVVVVSSAIDRNNPEILSAQQKGIPIVPRAEMLAELMRLKYGIAVAGTHGKTTTTSMLACIATTANDDPTVIVGGRVDILGGNAKLGGGKFLIAEADESDGSFLKLSPVVTVITNIDNDHMDFYGQMEKLRMSFLEFANSIPYYGRCILCADDTENAKLIPLITKPHWTYGFSEDADFRIQNFKSGVDGSSFDLFRDGKLYCALKIQAPGRHNALNAVAALAAALEMDIPLEKCVEGLARFSGVKRRFELKGKIKNPAVTIVDDYGHHPTEMKATLDAARLYWPKGRVVVAFQPHRYSRTKICWDQFASSLKSADQVFVTDIYGAGESPIEGVSSEILSQNIQKSGVACSYSGSLDQTVSVLKKNLKAGDLLITLGAGSVTSLGPKILESYGS